MTLVISFEQTWISSPQRCLLPNINAFWSKTLACP